MKFSQLCLVALLPLSLAFACGGKDEGPSTPASSSDGKKSSCEEFCHSLSGCEGVDVSDQDECVSECAADTSTSRAGQEALSTCLAQADCSEDANEDTAALEAFQCISSELENIELSAEQKKYCELSVPKIQACAEGEVTASPLGSCEQQIGVAADEVLVDFNACVEEDDCAAMNLCLQLQLLQIVDFEALSGDEDDLSPGSVSNLLTLLAIVGQWGGDTTGGVDLGDFLGDDDSSAGDDSSGMGGSGAN